MNQKKTLLGVCGLAGLAMIALVSAALLSSCAGPPGPPGPVGPAGESGKCSDCHNDTTLVLSKQIQAGNSAHMKLNDFERNLKDCAICHSSEGFVERVKAGSMEIKANISNPSPPNCRTCHNIHTTNTKKDFALRTATPVKIQLTGKTIDLGEGNLCAQCHQPRWVDKTPVDGPDIKVASERYGPHHGTQSVILAGQGGYGPEFKGSSVHATVKDGCVSCHMAEAYGRQAGGHSFWMSYEFHGAEIPNLAGCTSCHKDIKDFNRNNLITTVDGMISQVKGQLIAKGLLNKDTGLPIAGTYSAKLVGAIWNYQLVTEDRSHGVHNPQYAKALLTTALDALK